MIRLYELTKFANNFIKKHCSYEQDSGFSGSQLKVFKFFQALLVKINKFKVAFLIKLLMDRLSGQGFKIMFNKAGNWVGCWTLICANNL